LTLFHRKTLLADTEGERLGQLANLRPIEITSGSLRCWLRGVIIVDLVIATVAIFRG
jgi:hypothetical protein